MFLKEIFTPRLFIMTRTIIIRWNIDFAENSYFLPLEHCAVIKGRRLFFYSVFGSKWWHRQMSGIGWRDTQSFQTIWSSIGAFSFKKSQPNDGKSTWSRSRLLSPPGLRTTVPVECSGSLSQTFSFSHTYR